MLYWLELLAKLRKHFGKNSTSSSRDTPDPEGPVLPSVWRADFRMLKPLISSKMTECGMVKGEADEKTASGLSARAGGCFS